MRDAARRTQRRDHRGFGGRFGAQRVIDGEHDDGAAQRILREQQQRQAVGAARYRQRDAFARRQRALDQAGQVGGEARGVGQRLRAQPSHLAVARALVTASFCAGVSLAP